MKKGKNRRGRISAIEEFLLLTKQYYIIMTRDMRNLVISLIFPIVAAGITVWIAGENMFITMEDSKSCCFVLVCSAIWGGLFDSIGTVVKERDMVKRDIVSGGMRIGCYTLSRGLWQFLLCLVQTVILWVSFPLIVMIYEGKIPETGVFWGNPLPELFISLLLLMYAANTLGLMISCFVKRAELASVLAPYILIVQLIFSGILFPLEGLSEIFSYVMVSRWGMEALGTIVNCNDLTHKFLYENPDWADLMKDAFSAEEMFEYSDAHLLKVWLILFGFSVAALAGSYICLHFVKNDSRE